MHLGVDRLLPALAERAGRVVDVAYSSVLPRVGLRPDFFEQGLGPLEAVDLREDAAPFSAWPPPHFPSSLPWRRVESGQAGSVEYGVFAATFPSPACTHDRLARALPPESRTAHALWVRPERGLAVVSRGVGAQACPSLSSGKVCEYVPHPPSAFHAVPLATPPPTVVHLAATGDQGYGRRMSLALPLAARGVGSILLESPYYGRRRPAGQAGARLRAVSDLLLLGRATIEEALLLLCLARAGGSQLGLAGLSMGGVHACMAASLCPEDTALAPLLAPRSAAAAYCHGALAPVTAWRSLARDLDLRGDALRGLLEAAAGEVGALGAARLEGIQDVFGPGLDAGGQSSLPGGGGGLESSGGLPLAGSGSELPTPAAASLGSCLASSHEERKQRAWARGGEWVRSWTAALTHRLANLAHRPAGESEATAQALLARVLETFTDVTRFPRPPRPDAAVLVGATGDAYVAPESVAQVARHLSGSEVRWVRGGHVTSFLLHRRVFVDAVADAVDRL